MGMNFGQMSGKMEIKRNSLLILFIIFIFVALFYVINVSFKAGYQKGMMDLCDYYKGDLIEYKSNLKPNKYMCSNMSWYEEDSFFIHNIYTNWSYE